MQQINETEIINQVLTQWQEIEKHLPKESYNMYLELSNTGALRHTVQMFTPPYDSNLEKHILVIKNLPPYGIGYLVFKDSKIKQLHLHSPLPTEAKIEQALNSLLSRPTSSFKP